ncbi:SLC7A6OS protein-like [Arapaima gigas]
MSFLRPFLIEKGRGSTCAKYSSVGRMSTFRAKVFPIKENNLGTNRNRSDWAGVLAASFIDTEAHYHQPADTPPLKSDSIEQILHSPPKTPCSAPKGGAQLSQRAPGSSVGHGALWRWFCGSQRAAPRRSGMNPSSAVLRVKRKRGTDAADALLLACKRIRPESSAESSAGGAVPEPGDGEIEKSVFKLVATVSSQDAPVRTHVQEALSRHRVAHALRPSAGSTQRIAGDLRSAKWRARQDERYRILSSHRTGFGRDLALPAGGEAGERQNVDEGQAVPPCGGAPGGAAEDASSWLLGDLQVFDIVHEEDDKASYQTVTSDPDAILCNSVKMIREKLTVSGNHVGTDHREKDDDYVYDLYFQETPTPGWIQDILLVKPYLQEGELVPEDDLSEKEVYEDEDDENEEGNWRNDYPDEEDSEEEEEERYSGFEDEMFGQRSWRRYQQAMLRELDEDKDQYSDSD